MGFIKLRKETKCKSQKILKLKSEANGRAMVRLKELILILLFAREGLVGNDNLIFRMLSEKPRFCFVLIIKPLSL